MNQQVNISIPDWLEMNDLEILKVEPLAENPTHAIVIVGDNLQTKMLSRPTIRLYKAEQKNEAYELTKELDALLFNSKDEAIEFSRKLPQISAIQLLSETFLFDRFLTY